jgi:hypothetical protein
VRAASWTESCPIVRLAASQPVLVGVLFHQFKQQPVYADLMSLCRLFRPALAAIASVWIGNL